jgi:hypothetical protein
MTRSLSGKWQVIATASCCAAVLLMLGLSGCSSASAAAAAESVATATAANVIAAATQPSTVTTMTSTVSTAQGASTSQAILGRWVRNAPVINVDGTLGTGVLAEIVFNKNGWFLNTSRAGVTAVACTKGTFKVSGSVLTTHIGQVQHAYTYQIKGSFLLVTNPATHQTVVFQRG